jgi:hypothetical protein
MYIKTSNGSFEIPFEPTNKKEMMQDNVQYDVYTNDNNVELSVYFDVDTGESWITLTHNNQEVPLKQFLVAPVKEEKAGEVIWN